MGIVDIRKQLNAIFSELGGVDRISHSYRGGGLQEVITFQLNGAPHELVLEGSEPFTKKLQQAAEALRDELSGENP